jgi:hypothetical protein
LQVLWLCMLRAILQVTHNMYLIFACLTIFLKKKIYRNQTFVCLMEPKLGSKDLNTKRQPVKPPS